MRNPRLHPGSVLPALLLAGLLAAASPAGAQESRAAGVRPLPGDSARFDPRATALLKRMGDAYGRLSSFDLHIEISSALTPLETVAGTTPLSTENIDPTPFQVDEAAMRPAGRLHLAFRAANHLLIDTEQTDPGTNQKFDVKWICDGQSFWSYSGDKKVYTREKAPGSIHDFGKLQYLNGGTLELLMLIGPNPFADLLQNVDGAHQLEDSVVAGVPSDVVSLQTEDPIERSEVRLYIGKQDGLLRRMEIESIPLKLHDGPIKVGSKLDALIDAGKPAPPREDNPDQTGGAQSPAQIDPPQPAPRPVGSFTRFENDLDLHPNFPADTFRFAPPKGALMLGAQPSTKRLTMKQRIALMAKDIRRKRAEMLRNSQK